MSGISSHYHASLLQKGSRLMGQAARTTGGERDFSPFQRWSKPPQRYELISSYRGRLLLDVSPSSHSSRKSRVWRSKDKPVTQYHGIRAVQVASLRTDIEVWDIVLSLNAVIGIFSRTCSSGSRPFKSVFSRMLWLRYVGQIFLRPCLDLTCPFSLPPSAVEVIEPCPPTS